MNTAEALRALQDQQTRDHLRTLSHCMALQIRLSEIIANSSAEPESPEWAEIKERERQHIDSLQKDQLEQLYIAMEHILTPGDAARLDRRVDDNSAQPNE